MKIIKIIVEGGTIQDVQNLPKGWDYFLDDQDGNNALICTAYACVEPQTEDGEFCDKHFNPF